MSAAGILGLGPHGERPAGPEQVVLSDADIEAARRAGFRVAVVLHTRSSDHARQHLAGLVATLGRCGVAVTEVVDCAFNPALQVRALARLVKARPDAIISLPVAGVDVAEAHRSVSRSGIRLVLIDNSPSELLPGSDYTCLVSADNFGLGEIAARLLAPHVPPGCTIGAISYTLEFFASAQREIAFRRWLGTHRPDLGFASIRFSHLGEVRSCVSRSLADVPQLAALFAVWDTPAKAALASMAASGRMLPITTVDLGADIAAALARGDVQGVAAQQPYDQGETTGRATVAALMGADVPPWIALPAFEVTRDNVVAAFQAIWHRPAPDALVRLSRWQAT